MTVLEQEDIQELSRRFDSWRLADYIRIAKECSFDTVKLALTLTYVLWRGAASIRYLKMDCNKKPDPNYFPRCYTYVDFNYEFCDEMTPVYDCRFVEDVGEPVETDYYDLYEVDIGGYKVHLPVPIIRDLGLDEVFNEYIVGYGEREPRPYTNKCPLSEPPFWLKDEGFIIGVVSFIDNIMPIEYREILNPYRVFEYDLKYDALTILLSSIFFLKKHYDEYKPLIKVLKDLPVAREILDNLFIFDERKARINVFSDPFWYSPRSITVRRSGNNVVVVVSDMWGDTRVYELDRRTVKRIRYLTYFM